MLLAVWVEGKPYSRWCELKAKHKWTAVSRMQKKNKKKTKAYSAW